MDDSDADDDDGLVHRRCHGRPVDITTTATATQLCVRPCHLTIACCRFLRNAYRVYEFAEGAGNNEAQEEWPFYAFESAPILLTVLAYTYWHFGKLLPDTPDAAWKQEVATACGKPWPPAGQCTDAADKLVTVTKSGPSNGAVAIAPTTDHDPSATDAASPASSVACAV